jgi:HAD superfamily hydrolase (TIGR01459 family)
MTKNLDSEGLRSVFDNYELFFIDLWGVVHNGIELHENAVHALSKISEAKKNYILLTNAPRPNKIVKNFLEKLSLDKMMRDKVFTSGEAALGYLKKNYINQKFYHIGPPRDFNLFIDFKNEKTEDINKSDYLLCTGLYDQHDQDLNFYKELLINSISKKMICTNPDLIVDRGKKREYCAGSVAMTFEKLGGEVIYFGKPYPDVYYQAISNNKKKVIAIGDNLRTDIKGANNMNYDSLVITSGVHKKEFKKEGIEKVLKNYNVKATFSQSILKW